MGCGSVSTFSPVERFQHIIRPKVVEDFGIEVKDISNGRILSGLLEDGAYEVKLVDGTLSSPYPDSVTINQFQIPIPTVTFWQVINEYVHKTISTRGPHFDWIIEIAASRVRIKYGEIDTKTRSMASAFWKLGIRAHNTVIFLVKNTALVHLLYFATWRMNAVVQIMDSSSSPLADLENSGRYAVICDRSTETIAEELMEKYEKKFIIISIGKLRRIQAVDITELIQKDDGKSCPEHIVTAESRDSTILVTRNGVCHTNTSVIIGFTHLGLLRHAGSSPRQYLYPMNSAEVSLEHPLTTIFWPISILFSGKTIIILDTPIVHSVVLILREFSISLICGDPEHIQKISRHIAEQGGSIPSVTSAVITSKSFSEKILRKGFPNLRMLDVIYGFEEVLFVSSTIPPPSLANNNFATKMMSTQSSGPLLHPHTTGTLGLCAIAKVVDIDTGVRQGPGEPGEICFKSGSAMKGYIQGVDPKLKKTIVDGWISSGDFGYYDSSGCLYVTGKKDLVFKYYADYISPRELEYIVQSHPDVLSCVVIGIPDELAGHVPCGVIVRRLGSNVSSKEIRTFVNSRVSNSKQLRGGIIFLEQLPETNELPAFRQHILEYINKYIHST